MLRASVFAIVALATVARAAAGDWPPSDPDQPTSPIDFTKDWAKTIQDIRTFSDLQSAAGAKGKFVQSQLDAEPPYVVFEWIGSATQGRAGRVRVNLFANDDFGVTILPSDGDEAIVLNNSGAFVCRQCAPPIDRCGHRPSWIPHDLHWDNFDCRCTLTGPQSVARQQYFCSGP